MRTARTLPDPGAALLRPGTLRDTAAALGSLRVTLAALALLALGVVAVAQGAADASWGVAVITSYSIHYTKLYERVLDDQQRLLEGERLLDEVLGPHAHGLEQVNERPGGAAAPARRAVGGQEARP